MLQLEEAFLQFIREHKRGTDLLEVMTAVDCGMTPGGSTCEFVKPSMDMIIVDNGAMQKE